MQTRQVKSEAYTEDMSDSTFRVTARLIQWDPKGATTAYAPSFDRERFEAAGTADVSVEIAPNQRRLRKVAILKERETGFAWACGPGLLVKAFNAPKSRIGQDVKPSVPRPVSAAPRAPVPQPNEQFLDRFGVFKKNG